MRFKLDENMPVEAAELLNKEPIRHRLWIVDEKRLRIRDWRTGFLASQNFLDESIL